MSRKPRPVASYPTKLQEALLRAVTAPVILEIEDVDPRKPKGSRARYVNAQLNALKKAMIAEGFPNSDLLLRVQVLYTKKKPNELRVAMVDHIDDGIKIIESPPPVATDAVDDELEAALRKFDKGK